MEKMRLFSFFIFVVIHSRFSAFAHDSNSNVVIKKVTLISQGTPIAEYDLSGNKTDYSDTKVVIKEGSIYYLKIYFMVYDEIVSGLRYFSSSERKGLQVDKKSLMIGSYGPKSSLQEYSTPEILAPRGMMHRGTYIMSSKIMDDDKLIIRFWKWSIDVKKTWN